MCRRRRGRTARILMMPPQTARGLDDAVSVVRSQYSTEGWGVPPKNEPRALRHSTLSLFSISCANVATIKMTGAASSLQLALRFRSWGGARPGAGRKARRRAGGVPHVTRPVHHARHPLHVTLRFGPGLPSLRSQVMSKLVRRAFRYTGRRSFRVIHHLFSRITCTFSSKPTIARRCRAARRPSPSTSHAG